MSNQANYRRRIRRVMSKVSDDAIKQGVMWYPNANATVLSLADQSGVTAEHAAIAMAHLSPQVQWVLNVRALRTLLLEDAREPGILHQMYQRARASLTADDPWSTFGLRANKTRNFARNLLCDQDAVTVDSWISRVVGIDNGRAVFDSPRLYNEVADAYRAVARGTEYTPAELQAITWVAARGRAA